MHTTGETITVQFCVSDPATAGLVDADELPAGVFVLNGVDHAATVTITHLSTGLYRASVTLPTIADGDELQVRIAATVGGVAGSGIVWSGVGVTARPADVLAALSGAAAIAAAVWAYATRTLTQSGSQIAAIVAGTSITVHRGDAISFQLTGLGSLAGRTKLWFSAKTDTSHPDTAALIKIEETAGLEIIAGATATPGNATLTVDDEAAGDVTISWKGVEGAKLPALEDASWDLQVLEATGPRTVRYGEFNVTADVTRAVS